MYVSVTSLFNINYSFCKTNPVFRQGQGNEKVSGQHVLVLVLKELQCTCKYPNINRVF